MVKENKKEKRVQFLKPFELYEELEKLPLIFLPLGPLEWHGPHLVIGVDPLNAEHIALTLANKVGGVVLPTLYIGTERERWPEKLMSLGLNSKAYIVGVDNPTIKDLYKSYYFPEEILAIVLRFYIVQCIKHNYKFIYLVNGHGAKNQIEVIKRLCSEFSNETENVKVDSSVNAPKEKIGKRSSGHAGVEETSLTMYCNKEWVDMTKLPAENIKLKYSEYGIVDSEGASGRPGEGFQVPDTHDPRKKSTTELGKQIFKQTIFALEQHIKELIGI